MNQSLENMDLMQLYSFIPYPLDNWGEVYGYMSLTWGLHVSGLSS